MLRRILLALALAAPFPAQANDTMAELRTGGLIHVRSEVVAMESEDLFISPEEVRVAYVFRNQSDADVDAIVAFPMPDVRGDPYGMVAVPYLEEANLLGFHVEVEGEEVWPDLEQRAFAAELDVTAELEAAGLNLNPFATENEAVLAALSPETRSDWVTRGLVHHESYDDGTATQDFVAALWRLKSTYWWRMTFPAGRPVNVAHRYLPSVGGTVAVTFLEDGEPRGERYEEYVRRFCIEPNFVRAVQNAARQSTEGYPPFTESWISYVLVTAGNWAGSIGRFTLTIDKGREENLVSFCGTGVRKIGPTTFQMVAEHFYPERDLDILILRRYDPSDWQQEAE